MTFCVIIMAVVGGLFVGFFIGRESKKFDGLFIVDDSDYETTRWTLDMKIDPKRIPNKKDLRLKVKKITEGDV